VQRNGNLLSAETKSGTAAEDREGCDHASARIPDGNGQLVDAVLKLLGRPDETLRAVLFHQFAYFRHGVSCPRAAHANEVHTLQKLLNLGGLVVPEEGAA
jgi:hypothetical protein